MLNNMNNLIKLLILNFLLFGCANIQERDKSRQIQTEILTKITDNISKYSQCAQDNNIFEHFKSERVRVELNIMLNHFGQIERFQADRKDYPEKFMDCIYNILDKTKFPKLEEGEAVQFTQPFIFRKD